MFQELMYLLEYLLYAGLIVVVLALTIYLLAYFDIFFMFVSEGQIRFVMKSKSFHRAVESIKGYLIEKDTGKLRPLAPGEKDTGVNILSQLTGIYIVGLWPIYNVFKYWFSWSKLKISGQARHEVEDRKEIVKSMLFRNPYPMTAPAAETSGNIPYDIETLTTLQATNPQKAMFGVQPTGSYLTEATARVMSAVRLYASTRTIDELRQCLIKLHNAGLMPAMQGPNPAAASFENEIMHLVNDGPTGLDELFGVKVVAIQLFDLQLHDPSEDKALTKATTAKAVAEELNKVKDEDAKGDAKAIRTRTDAQVYQIDQVTKANNRRIRATFRAANVVPGGIDILKTEALRDAIVGSKASTLVFDPSKAGLMLTPSASTAPKEDKPTT